MIAEAAVARSVEGPARESVSRAADQFVGRTALHRLPGKALQRSRDFQPVVCRMGPCPHCMTQTEFCFDPINTDTV